jgi:2OG-Fe(II) oxygenase superfamily
MHLKNYILHLPNFIPAELCGKVLSLYEKSTAWKTHSWYDAKKDQYNTYKEDCSILAPIEAYEQEQLPLTPVHSAMTFVNDSIKQYCEQTKAGNIIKRITLARMNRYTPDTHMSPHFDHIQSIFDGEEKGIPILSIIGNLNEGYVGGELTFFDNDVLPMGVGDIVVFPSCFLYPHYVKHVQSGTRYSFVCWAY